MKKLFAVLSILISGLSFVAAKPKSVEHEVFDGRKSFSVKAYLSSKIEYKKDGTQKITLYDKDGKVDYCHIYDSFGNQIYYRDKIHKISTKIKYDSDGRILSKKDSDGFFTLFEYGADGNLEKVRCLNSDGIEVSEKVFEYDSTGRKILEKEKFTGSSESIIKYGGNGNEIYSRQLLQGGEIESWSNYDENGRIAISRLVAFDSSENAKKEYFVEYTYEKIGIITRRTGKNHFDGTLVEILDTDDENGNEVYRKSSCSLPGSPSNEYTETWFEYDADGKGSFSKSTSDGKNFSYWFAEYKFYKDGRKKEIRTYVAESE
ncbi:MAG: RHS repeat domain-containing protein [Treponema sp.]|nr:RHS repeat domain-containing protein [Treponema sp.]